MAFDGFKTKKSPGPDQLKPSILKHLPTSFIDQIKTIYKACLALHYTPQEWLGSRVVFIPKPDKDSYTFPQSFRPISLSNYLLKGLERLVGWHMDQKLELLPVHEAQHGFRMGHSTESAISNTVNYIEKHVYNGEYCLAVFLDIQGAFDNIPIDKIKSSILKHVGNHDMANWYHYYLGHHRLEITQDDEVYTTHLARGFPQGGVLSAKFWRLAFDDAVEIINKRGMFGQAYADDLCLMIGGTDLEFMYKQTSQVLRQLSEWGRSVGLTFNPQKTEAILFYTGYKKAKTLPQLKMDGQLIQHKDEVKYLGVMLDSKLTWKTHINKKIASAKGIMVKRLTEMQGTFNTKPKLVKWAYTGVVRPKLT